MYEFEALLFSNPQILAREIRVSENKVQSILTQCREPENINDCPNTAPSKRLETLCDRFKKTSTGINIAQKIGIDTIREKCHLFNDWLSKLEKIEK